MFQSLSADRAVGLGVVAAVGISVLSAGLYNISCKKNKSEVLKKKNENKDDEMNKSNDVNQEHSELALAEHFGSCHCRNVKFKVRATRIINAVDTSSKIKFPRFTMRCSDFDLLCDDRSLSMYTVNYGDGLLGIHSFCSCCGVQILYAPTIEPVEIQVNVDCLDRHNIDKIHYTRHCTGETERLAHNHELAHMFNRRGFGTSEQQHQQFSSLGSLHLGGHHLFSLEGARHRPTGPPSFYSEPLLREASDPVYAGYMNACNLSTGGLSDVDEYSYGHQQSNSNHYDPRHEKGSFDDAIPSLTSARGSHHDRRSYSYEERLSNGSGAYSALSSATVSPMNASGSTIHSNNNRQSGGVHMSPNHYVAQSQQVPQQQQQHQFPHQQQRDGFPALTVPSSYSDATQQSPYRPDYNAADDLTDHSHTSSESSANYRRGVPSPAAVVAEVVRLERQTSEPATPHLLKQLKKHLNKYDEAGVAHVHAGI